MIKQLHIQHLAIIEKSVIDFSNGFTVLTGETGAGKSIIIHALSLLLGSQSSEDLIKTGHDNAFIEGVFSINKTRLPEHLKRLLDDNEDIIIWRRLSKNKSNQIRLNNQTITLKTLKEFRPYLLEIMGQHEHTQLFDPLFQLNFIDSSSEKIASEKKKFSTHYSEFKTLKNRFNSLTTDKESIDQKIEFLTFQLSDINDCSFKENEEEILLKQKTDLKEKEKNQHLFTSLNNHLTQAYTGLSEAHKEVSSTSLIDMTKKLHEHSLSIDDLLTTVIIEQQKYEQLDGSIDDIEERLDLMFRYKTKYHVTSINDLIKKTEKLTQELLDLKGFKHNDKALKVALLKKKEDCVKQAKRLHEERVSHSNSIAKSIVNALKELHFQHAEFNIEIIFNKELVTETGCDDLSFLISTNAGEPLKQLHKVASGGELSRIMLALRTLFSTGSLTDTLLLDEVDTGIGGHTAITIGKFIKRLSEKFQVIGITHLPQIAQFADHHYLISKTMDLNTTLSTIQPLSKSEKEEEFSRMTGGLTPTVKT
jgi:DNA repair protein RecN (Recombination protein N)